MRLQINLSHPIEVLNTIELCGDVGHVIAVAAGSSVMESHDHGSPLVGAYLPHSSGAALLKLIINHLTAPIIFPLS